MRRRAHAAGMSRAGRPEAQGGGQGHGSRGCLPAGAKSRGRRASPYAVAEGGEPGAERLTPPLPVAEILTGALLDVWGARPPQGPGQAPARALGKKEEHQRLQKTK